jgi:hypothetical protein
VNDAPLIPASLYGLRTWRIVSDPQGERLTATARAARWPSAGTWLEARCDRRGDHDAPDPDCSCGVHAWHPRRSAARRVLASRFEVAGIVEAAGAIELQDDGFRAERARPYAFVVTPGRNAKLAERLARRYGAQVVHVDGADALVEWCHERDLGLDEKTVAALLGPDRLGERHTARRRKRRIDVLRAVATVALIGALLVAGQALATGPASEDGIYGRTGWVTTPRCPPAPAGADHSSEPPTALGRSAC